MEDKQLKLELYKEYKFKDNPKKNMLVPTKNMRIYYIGEFNKNLVFLNLLGDDFSYGVSDDDFKRYNLNFDEIINNLNLKIIKPGLRVIKGVVIFSLTPNQFLQENIGYVKEKLENILNR